MPIKKPVKAATPEQIAERSRGALLGLAVGDALGVPMKGKRMQAPQFPELVDGPYRDMAGGGQFTLKPGQVTDETQLATCLATSLRQVKSFDPADVTRRYRAWKSAAFDIPEQIQQVFAAMEEGGIPAQAPARYVWIQSWKKAASSHVLARTAPIGVYFAKEKEQEVRSRASMEDAAITHHDPRCRMACVAFNSAIAKAIHSAGEPKHEAMVEAAITELTLAGALFAKANPELVHDIQEATENVRADLTAAQAADPMLYGPELHMHGQGGFVRVAFRLAFWELFHAPSFEAALVDVVNRGGDSDTNAAVTGALLGARYGEPAIPERWTKAVLEALFSYGRPGPLFELYHPRILLTLVES